MLTVAGHIAPMMDVPQQYWKANVVPPKLTPEEEERRRQLLSSIQHFNPKALKFCETDDRSAPLLPCEFNYRPKIISNS